MKLTGHYDEWRCGRREAARSEGGGAGRPGGWIETADDYRLNGWKICASLRGIEESGISGEERDEWSPRVAGTDRRTGEKKRRDTRRVAREKDRERRRLVFAERQCARILYIIISKWYTMKFVRGTGERKESIIERFSERRSESPR